MAVGNQYHIDKNPFDEEEDVNPFSNHTTRYTHSISALPPEPASYNYDRKPAIDITLDKATEVKKKEEALARAGVFLDVKNWPPFFPIIHHDIANEIPDYLHRVQYTAFATFLGLILCLLWNFISVLLATISSGDVRIMFLALLYAITGVPGAYFLWKDSAVRFGWFFIFYMIHIGFCIFAIIAPPMLFHGLSFTGIMAAIYVTPFNGLVGIFYFVGCGLFVLETLTSIWVFQRVYRYFRGTGMAAEAKRSAARGSAMAAMN
ncbi:Secretory carrier membrane protein [Corchorus olitorius]|uniref:Secretory carrier-associated membrane protein n=1 Tax=Corchorus olitorius TaxID=93759 RepID=A0A1R3H415_9ROSI|nr:Secretory carrier membrane protein [Corchorus olitorius]